MKAVSLIIAVSVFLLACASGPAPDSPSGVLKQYVEATRKQDIGKMKSLLSKGSLQLLEKAAADQRTTSDEILKREAQVRIGSVPETRNETIEGDTATVEIRNELNGQFDMKLPFVREDGAWKIARDRYIEELMKKNAAERQVPEASPDADASDAGK